MKILMVNTFDNQGGAARAAYRLHKGLLSEDVQSKILVQNKRSNDPEVIQYPNSLLGKSYKKICRRLGSSLTHLQTTSNGIIHSLNFFPSGLHWQINASDADIVHLHWVGNEMLSIREVAKIKKPLVWTLHDMWAFSGSEHYDDLNTPGRYKEGYLKNNRPANHKGLDMDRWTWKRKMRYWSDQELNIVTPSKWLANCARESPLFKNKNIQVIPNGLDLNLFKPIPKEWARKILNIDNKDHSKYILFGAMSATSDKRKGFIQLQKALAFVLGKNYHLLIFGSEGYHDINFGLPTTYLGKLNDDETLSLAYSAADVMVVPSLQDNLPNTAVEAVACGTPVVSFDIGGLPDIVDHKINGYLAEPYDSESLAEGIKWVLEDKRRNKELSINARQKAKEKFDIKLVSERYINLYEEILE